jgi:sugar lactone lactonase YvrE
VIARLKYAPGQGITVFQDKTNQANGLTRDLQGRLIACEHETRRGHKTGARRQHHRDRQQLPGPPPQPAQ